MKCILIMSALFAVSCADVSESGGGYQYNPPNTPFTQGDQMTTGHHGSSHHTHPHRPSAPPLGDQLLSGGTTGPQGTPSRPSRPGSLAGRPQRPQGTRPFGGPQVTRPQAPGTMASGPQRPFGDVPSTVGGPSSAGGAAGGPVVSTGGGATDQGGDDGSYEGGDLSAIPGQPGVDFPDYQAFPETSFSCGDKQHDGYYADVETKCQGFHVCHGGRKYDFLCPLGTIFHQEVFVCVWWNQFDCSTAQSLYHLNEFIGIAPPPQTSTTAPLGATSGSQSGTQGPFGGSFVGVAAAGGGGAVGGIGGSRPGAGVGGEGVVGFGGQVAPQSDAVGGSPTRPVRPSGGHHGSGHHGSGHQGSGHHGASHQHSDAPSHSYLPPYP